MDRRDWHALSEREATEIFDAYVSTHDDRLRAAVPVLEALADGLVLDFSPESLDVVWPTTLAAYSAIEPGGPVDVEHDASLPHWVAFRPLIACEMGVERIRLSSHLATYFAEVAMRLDEEIDWAIADVEGHADYRKTVLMFGPDGARLEVEGFVEATLNQAVDLTHPLSDARRRPAELREALTKRADALRARRRAESTPGEADDLAVDVEDSADGTFRVTSRHDVDEAASVRLDDLACRLAADPRIRDVHREDREVLLVRAPGIDPPELRSLVDGLANLESG